MFFLQHTCILFLKCTILSVRAMERLDKLITEIRDLRQTMENQIMGMQDELKKSKE